jgi:hypothetical protein
MLLPVGVEDVCGVVALVIARALAWLAVAVVSGRSRVSMEPAYVVVLAREAM